MSNSIVNTPKPVVSIPEAGLDVAGFTNSGKSKFKEVVQEFSDQVFEKSVLYGETAKGDGLDREVTHDHVKSASLSTTKSFGKKTVRHGLLWLK